MIVGLRWPVSKIGRDGRRLSGDRLQEPVPVATTGIELDDCRAVVR